MFHEDEMTSTEQAFAAALGGLTPTTPARPRDDMLFRAGEERGRASFHRRLRAWQSVAALLAVTLATSISVRQRPAVRSNQGSLAVYVSSEPPSGPPDPYSALALRDAVLAGGLDALPRPAAVHRASSVMTAGGSVVWQ